VSLIFGLDSSARYCSIAIYNGDVPCLEVNFFSQDELSASLVPAIDWALHQAGITLQDIDLFGAAIGPGLFTGIRVGLATLKGLLFSRQKPVVPVIALRALAYKFRANRGEIIPLIDAGRKEIYLGRYRFPDRGDDEILSPRLISAGDLNRQLTGPGDFYFAGSGARAYREIIDREFGPDRILERSPFLAAEICRLAGHDFQQGRYTCDLSSLLPLYIRKPDAEQKLLEMGHRD